MQIKNGTSYHDETSEEMMTLLESIRTHHVRVRFHWGNAKTGEDWGDTMDVRGKLLRSQGSVKVPILLHNISSSGGPAILDNCIVKITETKGGKVLYQHPKYFQN